MMRFKYLILFVFVFSFLRGFSQCEIVRAMLGVEPLSTHLRLDTRLGGCVRIVDQSKIFKGCKFTYKTFFVGVIDSVPVDFNSGRCVDLAILKVEKQEGIIIVTVFYTLSGQNDDFANLFMGTVKLVETAEGFEVEEVDIGNVQ